MAKHFDICIRGSGIVAHTLALHLASKQLKVALTAPGIASGTDAAEASPTPDVRAYALNLLSRKLLEAVRCWPAETHATPVLSMRVQSVGGGEVVFSAAEQGTPALNWIVDVPTLEAKLSEAVRFQPLIELFDSPQKATLTVVCEGRASSTREEFGIDWDVTPYDQWALATRVECAQAHAQVARQWFDQGEILAFLPLEGPQGKTCAVVWSVSPERARQLQAATEEDFCDGIEAASHNSLGSVKLTSTRHVWPLQQALARRWIGASADGNSAWALAGDSAHNMHPLAGQGLNMGLADVDELVRVLSGRAPWRSLSDQRMLRQYERARKAEFAVMGQANDVLHQLFSQNHPTLQALRNWGMNQFQRSGSIKHWVARRAMGDPNPSPSQRKVTP
ncbi:MAG: FAD-dependent monooxygenase [Rhodoferax sp.]|nr:FAD-dependent monooxygenase [Rhodoferax sp.]MCF8208790.1 FAD-dependent monooxygenase [Rhodoferax sp.]